MNAQDRSPRRTRTVRGALAGVAGLVGAAVLAFLPGIVHADEPAVDWSYGPEDATVVTGQPYPGDAEAEALLVGAEDRRLVEVRSISNAAGWTNVNQGKPYRLVTGNTYTLVLIAREAPYTLDDLLEYAPSTFVRQPDGSYLLSENIVVEQDATLKLSSPDGLRLHMSSTPDAFVSIVTIGGALEFSGTTDSPLEVTSWDPVESEPDKETSDGRAYIRVTGGHASFADVVFHDLGFWAGTTGGVSLTGTTTPDVLSDYAPQNLQAEPTQAPAEVYGSELLPAGGVDTLSTAPDLSGYSYVSAFLRNVVSRDNAYGMFITSADGVDIRDSTFEHNLVDGLVLHRYVTNTIVRTSTASDNGGDGFLLTRATSGISLDRVEATDNGRNGITLQGGPLADGPSATGTAVGRYGNNQVVNSEASGNGRYGIDVMGGTKLVVDGNTVTDQRMGIVVSTDVDTVEVTDNLVTGSEEQGIALRAGVVEALVRGNEVDGGEIGIYLRDAGGVIDRNTVTGVTNHAVTLIDQTVASSVTDNEVSGIGPSAIDVARAGGDVASSGNRVVEWQSTKPLDVVLRSIFQPLTVMWLSLGLLLLITALTSIGRRRAGIHHPYANRVPMSALTAGVVAPEALGLQPAPWSHIGKRPRLRREEERSS
ncbi:right-handed parallel beta-helix repeat-containing protein [Microbacterium sp. NPDC096154]|uniref:right-handed parallel beta-helix repeat-containing protein n=1 Tax=Microbacterium sp. NPDC096154 TaxID=3155549 RepID=UPI003321A64D